MPQNAPYPWDNAVEILRQRLRMRDPNSESPISTREVGVPAGLFDAPPPIPLRKPTQFAPVTSAPIPMASPAPVPGSKPPTPVDFFGRPEPAPPTEKDSGFFSQDTRDILLDLGLRMMATQRPDFLGAVGEAGLGASSARQERQRYEQSAKAAERELKVREKNAESQSKQVEATVAKMYDDMDFQRKQVFDTEVDRDGFVWGITRSGTPIPLKDPEGNRVEKIPDWVTKIATEAYKTAVISAEDPDAAWQSVVKAWLTGGLRSEPQLEKIGEGRYRAVLPN